MRAFVSYDCFAQCTSNVIAILPPNVVRVVASYDHGLAGLGTRTIPFYENDSPLIPHPLDLIYISVNHIFSKS
jgi:hypothetical protein